MNSSRRKKGTLHLRLEDQEMITIDSKLFGIDTKKEKKHKKE